MNIKKTRLFLFLLLVLMLSACSNGAQASPVESQAEPVQANGEALFAECPVTQREKTAFVPPEPYEAQPSSEDYFWYGTEALWTELPVDGTWEQLPTDKSGLVQKTVWWHAGYDYREEPQPDLTVSLYRYGEKAPAVVFDDATNGWLSGGEPFMLIGISVPEPGCWEIVGEYAGESSLSYVIRVLE